MKALLILPYGIILLLLTAACAQKNVQQNHEEKVPVVEVGKTVTFDYAAGFANGTLFDTSLEEAAKKAGIYDDTKNYQPVVIRYGTDPILPGYAEALHGMKEGEAKNVVIPPKKAYGSIMPNSTISLPKDKVQGQGEIHVGGIITILAPNGNKVPAFIKEIGPENITVDLNHPLAGQIIQFSVIVRKIE